MHEDAAVVVDGVAIAAVVPRAELPAIIPLRQFGEDTWLAPGFIDLQVNGDGDVLFNDEPTPNDALGHRGARLRIDRHRAPGYRADKSRSTAPRSRFSTPGRRRWRRGLG